MKKFFITILAAYFASLALLPSMAQATSLRTAAHYSQASISESVSSTGKASIKPRFSMPSWVQPALSFAEAILEAIKNFLNNFKPNPIPPIL